MRHLESAREVVEALGGIPAVAILTGRKTTTVSKWQAGIGSFPPATYFCMKAALQDAGYTAPRDLWRFDELNTEVPEHDESAHA